MTIATTSWRTASAEDAAAVHELTQRAYEKWIPIIGRKPLPMNTDYVQAVSQHRIDLFYQDDELVALIEMIDKSDHLVIENLCVAPSRQRQGLGKWLLIHAEQVAADLNLNIIKLDTNKFFTGNVELYQRAGYKIIREKLIEHGIHVHMGKALI